MLAEILKAFAILTPQLVKVGLRIFVLLHSIDFGLTNLLIKGSQFSRQVSVGFGQLLYPTGSPLKLGLMILDLAIKEMKGLLELLRLLTVRGHTRLKTLDHHLLSIASDLEGSHLHKGLNRGGGDECLEFGSIEGIRNQDKNLPSSGQKDQNPPRTPSRA